MDTQTMNTISALEKKLVHDLREKFGATYSVYTNCQRGKRVLYGKHITISFPTNVKLNVREVIAVIETYYGKVDRTLKITGHINGLSGDSYKDLTLILKEEM